jgi:hypothetical protein
MLVVPHCREPEVRRLGVQFGQLSETLPQNQTKINTKTKIKKLRDQSSVFIKLTVYSKTNKNVQNIERMIGS